FIPQKAGLCRGFRLTLLPENAEIREFLPFLPSRLVGLAIDRDGAICPAALGRANAGRTVVLFFACRFALHATGEREQTAQTHGNTHDRLLIALQAAAGRSSAGPVAR